MKKYRMNLEEAQEFYNFLQGFSKPDDWIKNTTNELSFPKLEHSVAYTIIQYLRDQEIVSEDVFQCSQCTVLFDDSCSGFYSDITGQDYCDNCRDKAPEENLCMGCGELLLDKNGVERGTCDKCENSIFEELNKVAEITEEINKLNKLNKLKNEIQRTCTRGISEGFL